MNEVSSIKREFGLCRMKGCCNKANHGIAAKDERGEHTGEVIEVCRECLLRRIKSRLRSRGE